jgi:RNA polymerase sigma-70 factor (ECF subfamily)
LLEQLLERIRAGDHEAAAELVRRYEPEIRRVVRCRLRDHRLRRVFDSMDICQSVMGRFFAYATSHTLDISEPANLLSLLATMTRNKLRDTVRHETRTRRDHRREVHDQNALAEMVPTSDPTPSQAVSNRDLLAHIRGRLDPEDLYLAEQRAEGREWSELAAEVGSTAEALRKRLARAFDKITAEMEARDACHA